MTKKSRAAALLGLGTGSRSHKLAGHRSAVRFPEVFVPKCENHKLPRGGTMGNRGVPQIGGVGGVCSPKGNLTAPLRRLRVRS